jgi:hypothetical protein
MAIRNPNSHELMPLPRGATYLAARTLLAGGDLHEVSMDRIATAEKLLQTADCVGTLACCRECDVPIAPCPVAIDARQKVTTTVLNQAPGLTGVSDERSVLVACMDTWQLTYADEQAVIAAHLAARQGNDNLESRV